MVDGRAYTENASASSEDSIKPPPRLDSSRIKPGPGALPADAFDPLKHDEWEQFWHDIDKHFQPINQDDVRFLRSIPVNPYSGLRDEDLRVSRLSSAESRLSERVKREPKKEKIALSSDSNTNHANHKKATHEKDRLHLSSKPKTENVLVNLKSSNSSNSQSMGHASIELDVSTLQSSLNSFPFTHRLVAAFLDEHGPGGTQAPSTAPSRSNKSSSGMDDTFWMGIGAEKDIRSYQQAFEERLKVELVDSGLLDEKQDDELQTAMRNEQWKLRDMKAVTRTRKSSLYTLIVGTELRAQAIRREIVTHNDQVEIAYLERMVRNMKKNKKSRSKFQKLLHRMFGHYKEQEKNADKAKKAAESLSNGRLLTNGDERGRPSAVKKKKKKADSAAALGIPNGGISKGGTH